MFGAKIGRGVRIRASADVEIPWNIDLREGAIVGDRAILYSLGMITVGERAVISQYAHICAGTHDHADRRFPLIRDPIVIGPGAWIGTDAFVGPNVTVGPLAVLGARASAYKNLEPGMIYGGNPAKLIKKRELPAP
jgi:putative colanic acid biosynthesis acetyltransferase WcaF